MIKYLWITIFFTYISTTDSFTQDISQTTKELSHDRKSSVAFFLVPISRGVKLPHSQWEMDLNTTLIPNTTSKIFKKIMHVECSFYNKGIKVADLSNLWISIINAVLYKSHLKKNCNGAVLLNMVLEYWIVD